MQVESAATLSWLIPDWPTPPGVHALSTWRSGGVSAGPYASLNLGDHVGDAPQAVDENRRRLCAAADLPTEPNWLRQVHGIAVADLDRLAGEDSTRREGERPEADAAVARGAQRICAILTADCLPVLLAARTGAAVAAAHAGWRGLAGGVLAATVQALALPPGNLIAWLGPCIGPSCYEVGSEVRAAFLAQLPQAEHAFRANERGRYLADLAQIARIELHRLGVAAVYGGEECTHRDAARYFSHRRDGRTGRQATLIWRMGFLDG